MLGLIFHYTGSLWLCILGHFFNNALAVTQLYYYTSHGKAIKDVADQNTPFLWGLAALPLLVILLVAMKRLSPQPQADEVLTLDEIRDKAPWEIK
jgi:hypothetical protein